MCFFFDSRPWERGYTSLSSLTRLAVSWKLSSVGEKVLGRSLFWGLAGGTNGDGSAVEVSPLFPAALSSFIWKTVQRVNKPKEELCECAVRLPKTARNFPKLTSEYEGFSNVVLGFSFRLNKLHFDSWKQTQTVRWFHNGWIHITELYVDTQQLRVSPVQVWCWQRTSARCPHSALLDMLDSQSCFLFVHRSHQ